MSPDSTVKFACHVAAGANSLFSHGKGDDDKDKD